MCIEFDGNWRKAPSEMYAYKIIDDGDLIKKSMFNPLDRVLQRRADCWNREYDGRGEYHVYTPGYHESPEPGFFLVLTELMAKAAVTRYGESHIVHTKAIIRVIIPKGTQYITGRGSYIFEDVDCINALSIKVSQ